jgi:hypothetical protein
VTTTPNRLAAATSDDLADALAFALRFDDRKRKHDAGEFMAKIVARRLFELLDRASFVALRKPSAVGDASALGRGFEGH